MTDLSALSDSQLQALYSQPQAAPDVGKMSDAELMAAYHGPSMGEDAAKSIGAGLGNATIGTVGGVGDLRALASHGVDALGGKLGFDPSMVKSVLSNTVGRTPIGAAIANAPTSQQVRSTVTDPIVSPDYQPQTELGSVLKKGAEFAPNMLLGGPEGLGSRFLTNVAAPAIGSEIGEKAAGPYGGVVGALLGGAGATSVAQKFNQMAAARTAAKALPSAEDLLSTASNQFENVKASNLIVKPQSVEQIAKDIKTELLNEGYHPSISSGQSGVFNTLDRLENMGGAAGGVTPKDLEVIRKNLTASKMDADAATRQAAKAATDSFMQKYSNLGANDVLHGNVGATTAELKDAIGNYAAGKRSNTVMGKVDLANLNANTAGSGANIDNATRQAVKQLVRPVNNTNMPVAKKLGFNDQEVDALRQAATGTATGNTARYLGKYAPTGIVSVAGGAGLGHIVGGPVGAAIPVVGYIAKKIGDLSTKRAVSAIDSLVRSRSPLAAQVSAQLPPQVIQQLPAKTQRLLQALVLADPVLSKQARQPIGQDAAQ